MILFDFNHIVIVSLARMNKTDKRALNTNLVRHIALNTIRSYIKKYKTLYGPDVIMCCDSKKNWRKEYYPYYKAKRSELRDNSDLNWKMIFDTIDQLKSEIREYFPYRVIEVEKAEADDIIGTLCRNHSGKESILIISSDEDFIQLQKYPNIKQYSPSAKGLISSNPNDYLVEHIITGDRSDGVPNILSSDTVFVDGGRQSKITKKRMDSWKHSGIPDGFPSELLKRNYQRNKTLIDLECTPEDICRNIEEQFSIDIKRVTKQEMMNYFIKFGLGNLIESLEDF